MPLARLAGVLAASCALSGLALAQAPTAQEIARWKHEAQQVTIVRDDWGIAHVHGATDADAVFGMEYTQAEDDFNRVENNYLLALGWSAQAQGESAIWQDLRMRLFIDPVEMKKDYAACPPWLQSLMDAFADGLNYYLYTHPNVHPQVIHRFEPWMALAFTDGSIGGDIERANLRGVQGFYAQQPGGITPPPPPPPPPSYLPPDPTGSNGIAISAKNSADHHALLWINPHTSFYFRSELQMSSDQGLDAYGAVTWGQFSIYQGFNPRLGWMHTSSGVNNIDFYLETVTKSGDGYTYKYGDQQLPVKQAVISIPYKRSDGSMAERKFTGYWTQHGPVIGEVNGKWETIRLMQEPVKALEQDFERTKAKNYQEFHQIMELHTNSSNNTIYADADGHIAYFHSDFIPRRDDRFDWNKPVDGSDPATDWHGVLSLDQTPHLLDPASGWLYNSNNWPWSAAGPSSPKREAFPKYVDRGQFESMRGVHAVRVLSAGHDFTPATLIGAAFDSYQPWFTHTIPALVKAWDNTSASNPLKAKLHDPIEMLRTWNLRWGVDSIPTSVAVYWGGQIMRVTGNAARKAVEDDSSYVATQATPDQLLQALSAAIDKLNADFGTWKTPWGEINRFQRLDDSIYHPKFDDSLPSTPVEFTTAVWGSLASFAARQYPGTKRIYGSSGNSFVAVVDFGPRVTARAITAGGESGDPNSPHFRDEAERYATGNLRTVYFYPEDLKGHTERSYHPGQ